MRLLIDYLRADTGKEMRPSTIVAPQLWDAYGETGALIRDYWDQFFAGNAGFPVHFTAVMPEFSSNAQTVGVMRMESAPQKHNVLFFAEAPVKAGFPAVDRIAVVSEQPGVVFVSYSGKSGLKREAVALGELRAPSLLRYGLFAGTISAGAMDFDSLHVAPAAAGRLSSLPALALVDFGPKTLQKDALAAQISGQPAWFTAKNASSNVRVMLDGKELETVFANPGLVTALVPADTGTGTHQVYLSDSVTQRESGRLSLEIQ